MSAFPKHFQKMQSRFGDVMDAMKSLAQATDEAGPLDLKTAHLLQLGAAATLRAEGAVHSHTRRALQAGATPEEIRHAVMLLLPTIGYPTAATAMCWVDDILDKD